MNIINELEKLDKQKEKLINKLYEQIKNLPDNEEIEKKDSNIYTVKSSVLFRHSSWDPKFLDYKKQYIEVIKVMKNNKYPISKLKKLLDEGKFRYNSGIYTFKLHPEVVENIKKLL
jgi:hypothetical protein